MIVKGEHETNKKSHKHMVKFYMYQYFHSYHNTVNGAGTPPLWGVLKDI